MRCSEREERRGDRLQRVRESLKGRSEYLDRRRQADSRGETGSMKTPNNEGLRGSCSLEEQPGDTEPEIRKDGEEIT